MANQALGFAELLAGGVLATAALTGSSVRDVLAGKAGPFRGFSATLAGSSSGDTSNASSADRNAHTGGIYTKKNLSRVDQGVDFRGSGDIPALGSGTITRVQAAGTGWPGAGGAGTGSIVTYALDTPVRVGGVLYHYIYVAENFLPNVHVGQRVKAGQSLGTALGISPYTEQGFAADAGGTTYARTHGGYTEGQQTQAGKDFLAFLGL